MLQRLSCQPPPGNGRRTYLGVAPSQGGGAPLGSTCRYLKQEGKMHTSNIALVLDRVSVRSNCSISLKEFSLTIQKGSFHGLLGFGTSGKTVTARLAAGMVKPDSGSVQILGANGPDFPSTILRKVGYQAQAPAYFPRMTLWEQLLSVAGVYGQPSKRAGILVEALDLENCKDTRIELLGDRELRLLSVATAVVHDPEFLVLDEPTFGLDPADRKRVISLLRSSNIAGMTTLYATRNLDELERLCDEVTVIGSQKASAPESVTS